MKTVVINGSPKAKDSASGRFAEELRQRLEGRTDVSLYQWNRTQAAPEEMDALMAGDVAVLVFPLYVDGIPSHLLRIMEDLEQRFQSWEQESRPTIYAMVNCGFFEGDQAALSLEMVRHWCLRCGCVWGTGVGIGSGPMLSMMPLSPGKGPARHLAEAYDALVPLLLFRGTAENEFVTAKFPRRLYMGIAHAGWVMEGRRNGLRRKELYRRTRTE